MTSPQPASERTRSTRLAAWAFGLYVAVALPLVVFGLGSYFWFLGDDWDFLSERQAGSLDDLFRPHAEHLSTLPILVTRAEWHLFGFHYWRYQFVLMAGHLTVAVLLRVVLRRIGIGPWVATSAAAIFVLFSPGYENLLWSFQLAWVMALTFGLLHLIAADHDSPGIERRDWLGLLAGLGAILSAGIAPVLIGVVGLAALLRRGWRAAAFHTVPLAVLFLIWFTATRGDQPDSPGGVTPVKLARWLESGYSAIFTGLGAGRPLGMLLVALMVVGAGLAWGPLVRARQWADLRQATAIPVSMALGGFAFQCITAPGRLAFGVEAARASRYVYVGALLVIPLLAVGANAVVERSRSLTPVIGVAVVLVLLAPIPGNIAGFDPGGTVFNEQYFTRQRTLVEAIAWSPLAERVPPSSRPIRDWIGEGPSVGWLLDARAADRVARPANVSAEMLDEIELRLGIRQTFAEPGSTRPLACRTYGEPLTMRPDVGTRFRLESAIGVRLTDARQPALFATRLDPLEGTELEIVLDDLDLAFAPLAPATTFRLCS